MNSLRPFGAQPPPRDPGALARDVLAQSRFRIHATPAARTWWDGLRDWLGQRWNQLMDAFSHHVRVGAKTSIAIGDVLLAVFVGIVVIAGARLLLSMAREAGGAGARATALPAAADPLELHGAAQVAAGRGDYAIAIALEFRAALAALDARGVLRDDPARTVNECRRDVRARVPGLSAAFDAIARAFTAAVYAEDRVTAEHWNDVERAYAAFAAPQSDAA